MSLYLTYEQRADDLRKDMREMVETAAAEKREMSSSERDKYFNMQGEADTLISTARELRDKETEDLRGMAESAHKQTAAASDGSEDRARMSAFVREARVDGLKEMRSGEALAGTDANGGVLVPEPVHADFVDKLKEDLPILRLARFYDMVGGDSVTIQRKTARAASGGIKGETAERPTTNAATYEEVSLKAYEYYANPRASQLFLDSVANAESDIYADLLQTMREDYGEDLINGTGVNANDALSKPQGLLVGVTAHIPSGSASALTNTAVHNLIFNLASAYASKGVILGSRATLGVCDAFAHPASANIPLVTWQNGKPYILGKEFIECEDMPAIGAGAFPLIFGDINSAYGCGVHRNWTMLRDPYTDKPFIHFYTTGRMGGIVRDPNAAVKLEVAAS